MCIEIDPVVDEEAELKTEQGQGPQRADLPTLPLKLRQTQGGYKAIEDAEDRLVTFIGMREDDRAWGEFLINPANSYESLRAAAQTAIKVLSMEFPGSIKRKEAIAQLEAALNPKN